MENWINHDQDLAKHEKREKLNLGAQKLLGIIRDVYRKINRSKPATVFPTHETIKTLKHYQMESERRKSEAFAHLYNQMRVY